jgi:hypothetical protein
MNGSPVARLVRGWVDLYTRGLPADARAARRDEIDDDLWCEHAEAAAAGRSARSLDADLFMRLLFGMPSDISWRMTFRAERATMSPPRSTSVDPRIIGSLAIVGGLAWEILGVLAIPVGFDALVTEGGALVVVGFYVGVVAFPATALFLAWLFQDEVSLVGTFGALLVMLGTIILGFSSFVVPLAVGSAMLTWRLARVGAVPRLVPVVQAATAIVFTVGLSVGLGSDQGIQSRALLAVLFTPYLLTWIAIGVSLIRGVPQAQARGR